MNREEIIKKVKNDVIEIKNWHDSSPEITEYELRVDLFRNLLGFVSCCFKYKYISCDDSSYLNELIYKEMTDDALRMLKDLPEELLKNELSKFKELYDKFVN